MGGWLTLGVNALAASVFLNAGLGKLVAPERTVRALGELRIVTHPAVVRGFAAAEVAVAFALTVSRVPAAIMAGLFGLCFAGLGVLGLRRRGAAPCGCLGGSSRLPLGWANVGIGLALVAVYPINAVAGEPSAYVLGAVLCTAVGASALCLWLNREVTRASGIWLRFAGALRGDGGAVRDAR